MSVRTELKCDGCDKIAYADIGETFEEIRLECLVSLNGGADQKYDLCQRCQDRLAEAVDPTKWVRAPQAATPA